MDPSTSQHRQDTVVPTAIVTKADSEKWAKVLAHLHKVGHQDISFAHMTLLEEVHYIRNPAGGGWKAASWVFKMRSGAVFAAADEAAAFMRHKLQDPAVRAAATAAAVTLAAQHSAAAGAHAGSTAGGLAPSTSIRMQQHASVTARQGVRPAAMPCELPPAKKQRPAQQDGTVAAAVAASAVQQRQADMQQNRADAGMRAPCSTAGAAAASQGAGKNQQLSGVASHASLRPLLHQDSDHSSQCGLASRFILEASGALVRCFPHTAGPGSRASTVTPGTSCSSRVFVNAVSGRPQPKLQQQLVQEVSLPPQQQQQQQQRQQGGVGTSSDEECSLADMARAWQAQQQQQEFQPQRPRPQLQQLQQQRQQQPLPQQHGAAGGGDLPPCPRLVYDTRRRNKELDLHTALEITAAQYMEWLAATGAQDVPGDGEELASCLLDGEDPIVQLKGITPAVFTELRGVLPANFAPIVQGHRRPEPSDVEAADQQPPLQQQQQQQQVKAAAAACAAAAAAGRKGGRGREEGRQHCRDSDGTYDGASDSPSKSSGGDTDRSSGSEATDPGMDCQGSPAGGAVSLPAYLRGPLAAQHVAARAVGATPVCETPARQTSFSSTSSVCMAAPAAASARKPAAPAQHASRLGLTNGPITGSSRAAGAAVAAAGGDGAADAHLGAGCGPLTDSSRIAGAAGPAAGGDVVVDASTSARQRSVLVGFPSELHTYSSTVAGALGAAAAAVVAAEEVVMAAADAGLQVHSGIQCGPHTHSSMAAGAAGVAAAGGVAVAAAAAGLQEQVEVQCGPYTHNNMAAGGAGAAAAGDIAVAAAAAGLQVHIGVPFGPLKAEAGPGSNGTTPTWSEADTTERHHFADAYSRPVQQQLPGPAFASFSLSSFGSGLRRRDPRAKLLGAAAAGVLQPPPPPPAPLLGPLAAAAPGEVLPSPPAMAALLAGPLAAAGAAAAAGPVEVLPSPAALAMPTVVPAPVPPTQHFGGPGEELGSAGGRGIAEGQVPGPAAGMCMGDIGGPGHMFGTDGDVGQAGGPGAGLPGPEMHMGQVGGPVAGLPGSGGESGEAGGPAAAGGGGVAAPAAGTSGDAAAAPVGATGVASGAAAASGGAAAWGAAQGPTGAAAVPPSINDPWIQQAMAAMQAEAERLRQERDAAMEMCLRYQEEIRMSRAVFGVLSVPVDGLEAGEGAGSAGGGGDGDGGGNMQE